MPADPTDTEGGAPPATHGEPSAVHPIPAVMEPQGFRILVMRELQLELGAPSAFALMNQGLLRMPQRLNRNSLFFANTFRPEVFAWLIDELGRPSVRDGEGRATRNARWPNLSWHNAARSWPDGSTSVEWSVAVHFPEAACWAAFRARWQARLDGLSAPLDEDEPSA